MIIYGTREKVFLDKNQTGTDCSYCGNKHSVVNGLVIKYFHIFWIPFFPYKNKLFSHCIHCKKERYTNEIPLEDRRQIKKAGLPKRPIWLFSGLIIIGCILLFALISSLNAKSKTTKYLNSPHIGDVYTVKVYNESEQGYTLFRITNIVSDSITFEMNNYYATSSSKIRKLKEEHKNDYSEKITYPKKDIDKMNKDGDIRDIERDL